MECIQADIPVAQLENSSHRTGHESISLAYLGTGYTFLHTGLIKNAASF